MRRLILHQDIHRARRRFRCRSGNVEAIKRMNDGSGTGVIAAKRPVLSVAPPAVR